MLQHDQVNIGGKIFHSQEDSLLIEVGGEIKRVRLYDEGVKSVRLIKYHVSHSCSKVVFFFLQRNSDKMEDLFHPDDP